MKIPALLLAALFAALPLNAQDNLRDGAPFNGYTGVVFDTSAYTYDYLVDSSLAQDDPAGHKFKTLQAAYAAAPAGTPAKPTVIGIKPDVYRIAGTETAAGMTITKSYITLLGLTDDRRKVVLADNRGNKEGASNNGFVFMVNATGFTAMNLTFLNYCNMDYEYPGNPSKNLTKRSDVITQAVAIQMQGDKHVYSHVAFLGRLDTTFIQTTRSYFTNVFIEGTDDFIGGGTVGYWKDSQVYFPTGNGVMSASGIAFVNTVFKAARGLEFYKGFRSPVTLIDCTMPVSTAAAPVAWLVWKTPVRQNVYSLTYHLKDANGKPLTMADSIVGPPAFTLSREISAQEAAAFNPWNMLRATPNGTPDDWDPANARAQYESHGSDVYRMAFAAPPAPAGIAPAAAAGPFTAAAGNTPSIRTGGTGLTLTATVSPARAQTSSITWTTTSPLATLSAATGPSIIVTGHNTTNHAEYVTVKSAAADGFFITAHILVEPAYIAPPAFAKQPIILPPANGKATVSYGLNLGGRDDESLITWYLCDTPACTARRTIAVSRGNQPLRDLPLSVGDVGKYLEAGVQPKHNISDPGAEVTAIYTKPIAARDIKSTTISPNFRNFVTTENKDYVNGEWTILGAWSTVTADNYATGYGIRIGAIGAQLLYQDDAPTGDMQVKVVMSPEKTQGQGFGIAGSPSDEIEKNQKADIFIKYDPRTRTGYSLRFWRTIQSAEKCAFQLYKITDGAGTPVNVQQQLTGVFKPDTTITLSIIGNTFKAVGSNTVDGETLSLSGTITPNQFGGAGVTWSGSTPVGNSNVFSLFEITYPGK